MSPSCSPPIAQTRIPRVKELYESLGFGSAFKRPTADPAESTHSWRKEYVTHDGIPGRDLRDWKSLSTRNGLELMAAEFVKAGRGEEYWPLNGCASPRLIPEYPIDKCKIIGLLQQLFWRQNINAAHNANSSDQAQGRESASSDRTSATLSLNAATNHHTWLFDAYEERNKVLQLHARALPDGTQPLPRDANFNSDAVKSPSQRAAELSAHHRESLSDTHFKWGVHSGSAPKGVSERPRQPAQLFGAAKYSARSSASEDIYAYRGSDGERGQSKRKSSKIVKLKYHKQSTKKAIADHVGKEFTNGANERPFTARGIAPEAVMIPPSAKVTVTPNRRLPERGYSPSKPGSSTEYRGPKRKSLHDDDEAEYSPRKTTKRKKFLPQKLRDSVANARPARGDLHLQLHNKDSPVVLTGVRRGVKLPSISAGQRHNSPISISDGMNESDDPVSPPAAAGQNSRRRCNQDPSPASTERHARKRAEQIRKPIPTLTSPDCQVFGQNDQLRAPSARYSQDPPGQPPKMSALMGSFRIMHADPFRPMLPVPHTDTMALAEAIREADLYPVSHSDPEAEETRQVFTAITDASNGTRETQGATLTFSPPKQAGTDKSPKTSDARPLILNGVVNPQTRTAPTLNTQEQAPTSEAFQKSDTQRKGRADVSQSPADSMSNAPKQNTTVEAVHAHGKTASELANSNKGHPTLTSNPDSPKLDISESLIQPFHKPSPVFEEAEEPRHLPVSTFGPPSEPMELQTTSVENTPAASSKEDGNIHLSPTTEESVPKLSHQNPKVHLPITTGYCDPEPPKEAQSHPPATSGIDIRYLIVVSQVPRPVKQRWDIQSLSGKSVESLFEEVSNFISKPDIQRIDFKLRSSQADFKSSIKCKDSKAFENMKEDFADDIMADVRDKANTKFTIWLEPDPIQQDPQIEAHGSGMGEGCPQVFI